MCDGASAIRCEACVYKCVRNAFLAPTKLSWLPLSSPPAAVPGMGSDVQSVLELRSHTEVIEMAVSRTTGEDP